MNNFALCMKYDTCRRCPKNKFCEKEYQKQVKEKERNEQKNKQS